MLLWHVARYVVSHKCWLLQFKALWFQAQERRDTTLLTEYKRSQKANQFVDRRFGSKNEDLSHEEKMLARFKKERVRQSKHSSKFGLAEGEQVTLTHRGQALGDAAEDHDMDSSDEEAIGKG